MEDLHESGATFAYPDALRPVEWALLQGFRRGRAAYQVAKDKRDEVRRNLKARAQQNQHLID